LTARARPHRQPHRRRGEPLWAAGLKGRNGRGHRIPVLSLVDRARWLHPALEIPAFGRIDLTCGARPAVADPGSGAVDGRFPIRQNRCLGGRAAGCTLCCKIMGVPDKSDKPRGAWCPPMRRGKGCGILCGSPRRCRASVVMAHQSRFGDGKHDERRSHHGRSRRQRPRFSMPIGLSEAWRKEPY